MVKMDMPGCFVQKGSAFFSFIPFFWDQKSQVLHLELERGSLFLGVFVQFYMGLNGYLWGSHLYRSLRIRVIGSHVPQKSLNRVLATPSTRPGGGKQF